MSKVSKIIAFTGLVGLFGLSGLTADQRIADPSRKTGLKPIDEAQIREIRENWPRISRVHLNQLGLERINAERAKKGKGRLDPKAARPVGQELESAVLKSGVLIQAAAPDPEIIADLPPSVDNSLLQYFPPIRDQGWLNACAAFATTYTQFSYMTAFQRGLDIRNDLDNTNKYSPKWTYNMVNGGLDVGSYILDNYSLLADHGASTWAEFPYDGTDFLSWCLTTAAWRNAIGTRTRPSQYVYDVHTENGMAQVKELLNNGYVVVFGTFILSWQGQLIMNDPATPDDDAEVGKGIGYFVNGQSGSHAMTIVGYNDAIWTDVNGNSVVEPGEKGAFKVANSWGDEWQDNGFVWLAYDALRTLSALPDGPSEGRQWAVQGNMIFVLTARDDYSPSMIAEFTVNHAKREQMWITLGISDTANTTPSENWYPTALSFKGGAFAFDGTTTAVDGSFVFDLTDLLSETGVERRYYLGIGDNEALDVAALKAFKIIDLTTDTEAGSVTTLPISADGSQDPSYAYAQYTYRGSPVNHPPTLANINVGPAMGTVVDTFIYQVFYSDPDGDSAAITSIYVDGIQHDMTESPTWPGWYNYVTTLPVVGTHDYRFYFTDSRGESVSHPAGGTYSGPIVTLVHFVTQPVAPTGASLAVAGQSYAYATLGSTCYGTTHDIQYQFDWGDGTNSGWLPVGQESAQHAWSSSGAFGVRAQARCTDDTAVVSPWSDPLIVRVPAGIPFSESFASSGFPQGWIQQNVGLDIYNGWILVPTGQAGGLSFEMRCEFEDVVPGESRLVTAPINTSGHTRLRLRFKHFIQTWQTGGAQFKVQTSTDKIGWTDEAWTVTVGDANIGPATVDVVLANNLNSPTTYIAFVITGDLYLFDFWFIDDISITQATSPKADFNSDGQEDILWRYYGAGAYQGLNLVWLMNQTGPAAPRPLSIDAEVAIGQGLLSDKNLASALRTPLATGRLNQPPSWPLKSTIKTVLSGGRALVPKSRLTAKSPMEFGRKLSAASRGRAVRGDVKPLLARKDAAAPNILSSGQATIASVSLGQEVIFSQVADTGWEIAGTGDFNGDSKADILWRYYGTGPYQGLNDIWFMDGTTFVGEEVFSQISDTNWRVAGTDDFNGDGKTDILWRYYGTGAYQGLNVVWFMNGSQFSGEAVFSQILDIDWRIEGTGDFNGDGETDILWRYYGTGTYQGLNDIWFMNGTTFVSETVFSQVMDTAWQIAGTGDFDADGNMDILWRYYGTGPYQGLNVIWYMNGTAFVSEEVFSQIPDTNWRIVNR
jgi:hypothetical protein